MVSAESPAGTEEETSLDVPERAMKLHLRWEKEKTVPADTGTISSDEEPGMLPPDLRVLMENSGFGNLGGLSEEEIRELYKRIKTKLQNQRFTLLELEERKSTHARSSTPINLLHDIQDVLKEIDRLVKIKTEFDRWRLKHCVK